MDRMSEFTTRRTGQAFTLHEAASSLPAPSTVADGAAMPSQLADSDRCYSLWALSADFSTTATLTDGVLCAWDATAETWRRVAVLNAGLPISGTATLGWEDLLEHVGAAGTRFAVFGTLSAGTVTIAMTPIAVTS